MRLARDPDQVAHRAARSKQHCIKAAGLYGFTGVSGGRCCTYGAECSDVFDFPAQVSESRNQRVR